MVLLTSNWLANAEEILRSHEIRRVATQEWQSRFFSLYPNFELIIIIAINIT